MRILSWRMKNVTEREKEVSGRGGLATWINLDSIGLTWTHLVILLGSFKVFLLPDPPN